MEQLPKRRRLSHKNEASVGYPESNHVVWPSLHPGVVKEGPLGHQEPLRNGILPFTIPPDLSSPLRKPRHAVQISGLGENSLPKFAPRGLSEDELPEPPWKTSTASLVQVVVDLPEKPLTKFLISPTSSIIPLERFGTFTLNANSSPSQLLPSQTNSAAASSSVYSANSSVHLANLSVHSANSVPQSSPSQAGRNAIVRTLTAVDEPIHGATATGTFSPSSTSLKLNLPGPGSQVVLSSPPSTPIPSDPPSSVISDTTSSSYPTSLAVSSLSRRTQISPESTSFPQSRKPTTPKESATGHSSASTPSSNPGTSSTGKNTLRSRTSRSTTRPSSTSSNSSSATSLPTRLATSLSRVSHQSYTSFTAIRTKSKASSFITSISTQRSLTSSSLLPTASSSGGIGGGGGSGEPTETSNASPPSGTAASGGESDGDGTGASRPALIGGVVGGLAGLTIFCLLALFLLYRRRNRQKRALLSQPQAGPVPPSSAGQDATTTERSSTAPLAAAGFFKRLRPQSGQTAATTDTTPSERGFQNLGGRKLESVLLSRGDGYSEPGPSSGVASASGVGSEPSGLRRSGFGHSPGPSEPETFSRSSLYRDSQGFQGGNDGDLPSSSNLRPGSNTTSTAAYPVPPDSGLPPEGVAGFSHPDDEIAIMRPSPARTPVTGGFSPLTQPPRSPRNIPSPRSPSTPISRGHRDGLGRSHPSFDGSRGSRFTEDM